MCVCVILCTGGGGRILLQALLFNYSIFIMQYPCLLIKRKTWLFLSQSSIFPSLSLDYYERQTFLEFIQCEIRMLKLENTKWLQYCLLGPHTTCTGLFLPFIVKYNKRPPSQQNLIILILFRWRQHQHSSNLFFSREWSWSKMFPPFSPYKLTIEQMTAERLANAVVLWHWFRL